MLAIGYVKFLNISIIKNIKFVIIRQLLNFVSQLAIGTCNKDPHVCILRNNQVH